jgi:hypothetical protein
MLDGQNLDADGGFSVDYSIGPFKQLSHFIVDEGLQSDSAARRDQQCLGPIEYPFDHRQRAWLRILGNVIVEFRESCPRTRGPR